MDIVNKEMEGQGREVLVITEHGLGKKTPIKDYKIQKRSGSGIKTVKISEKTGKIVSMCILDSSDEEKDLLLISKQGQTIRTPLKTISTLGRATQGVILMRFGKAGDGVAAVAALNKAGEEEEKSHNLYEVEENK
jgi:DNA gyrase subunit A